MNVVAFERNSHKNWTDPEDTGDPMSGGSAYGRRLPVASICDRILRHRSESDERYAVVAFDACYDTGSTFCLKRSLNDGAPY